MSVESSVTAALHRAEDAWQKLDVNTLHRDPKVIGVVLAFSSSAFIGGSFVLTRKALQRVGLTGGQRAADGGYAYFREPLWWVGTLTMVVGEFANFSAYAYAPAILVTPLGAISIIVSAILADIFLQERLHICGLMGCLLCTIGSFVLVSYAPEEQMVTSVEQIWTMATQPTFLGYCVFVVALVASLIFMAAQKTPTGASYGETQVLLYVSICSLIGSLSVVSCKALGIALKLTFRGINQLHNPKTYVFACVVVVSVVGQMNYLNKALDTFNTAMVSSVYYIFFTICTITASMIMYKDWENQTATSISWQLLGFVMIVFGVYSLNATQGLKDTQPGCGAGVRAICGAFLPEDYLRRLSRKRVELEREVLLAGGEDGDGNDSDAEAELGACRRDGRPPGGDGGRSRSQPPPSTVPFDVSSSEMCRSLSANLLRGDGQAGR